MVSTYVDVRLAEASAKLFLSVAAIGTMPSEPGWPFIMIFVPSGGGAPGSSGDTGIVPPGGGAKVGAGFKSDGGMGVEPGGATGTPVAGSGAM